MKIEDILKKIRKSNIDISVNGDNLQLNGNNSDLSPLLLAEIKANKEGIIEYLRSNIYNLRDFESIPLAAAATGYPLSSSQRRLWILSQFEEGNIAYNMPGIYLFEGSFDRSALDYAFKSLLDRHEILRTVFRQDDSGEVRQVVLSSEELGFQIRYLDLQDEREQEDVVWGIVHSDW
ncbi:condensation domain-containing protein, partial [Pedobacter jeongneungensis]|uniref:condensation domain-containing protein n=1 Tax=Pedobacter jeongneungensis TaxID=947309 RepID=UPI0031F072F9